MKILTQEQVRRRCRAVGMSKRNARIGSAIAMVEAPARGVEPPSADFSKIGDQALANEIWGYSYGGFQIRSLREQTGTGGIRDKELLLDPIFNCMSAKAIQEDSGWKAWSTFNSGQYKAYLQDIFPPPPNTYVVLAGDTLSGIAYYYDMSWEELARINNIHEPYTIYIGQHLLLS